MKKNTKGFTLIELLAVIVILAIIALIATPLILNIINRARKSAAADSAYAVRKEAQLYYQFEAMTPSGITDDIEVKFKKVDGKGAIDGTVASNDPDHENKFELDGTMPTSGSILIEKDGIVSGAVEISGYVCGIVPKGNITCYSDKTLAEVKTLTDAAAAAARS